MPNACPAGRKARYAAGNVLQVLSTSGSYGSATAPVSYIDDRILRSRPHFTGELGTLLALSTHQGLTPGGVRRAVLALRRLIDDLEHVQVQRARAEGWSWQQIGDALGISRQAAHKKHGG